MSYKLYADDQCIDEIFSANEIREKAGYNKVNSKEEKKICNCPNCGAPVSSYTCEYCGTELEKPKKILSDAEKRESFANLVRKQQIDRMQASQEWQTQQILNTLNTYSVQTQIANIRDSLNTNIWQSQCYNYQDSQAIYQSQIVSSPYQGPKVQENEQKTNNLSRFLDIFAIFLLILFIISLVYTVFHFLP